MRKRQAMQLDVMNVHLTLHCPDLAGPGNAATRRCDDQRKKAACSWPLREFEVSEVAGTARCMIAGIVTELQVLAETRENKRKQGFGPDHQR